MLFSIWEILQKFWCPFVSKTILLAINCPSFPLWSTVQTRQSSFSLFHLFCIPLQDQDDDQFDVDHVEELLGPPLLHHHIDTNTTSTESSDLQNPSLTQFSLDEDGRIHPYVNFDLYYQAIDEAKAAGLITESQMHLYK